MDNCVDFDVHDLIRLRLVDATQGEVDAVQRQVGPLRVAAQGIPDVVIRFVGKIHGLESMSILGNWEVGYSAESFWILSGKHGSRIVVQLPMDRIGMRCEILCQHTVPAIPLLGSILNLIALAKGFLPLHASAFVFDGESILTTGWAKGGKTESLLGFAEQGATYVGDEWIYVDPMTDTMRGVPQPIHLWDWHLDSACHRARLTRAQRFKLAVFRQLHLGLKRLARPQTAAGMVAQKLAESVNKRRHVQLTPKRLFGERVQPVASCPRTVFFMASHAASTIEVRPISVEEIAARMAVSLEDEFESLVSCYRKFRFAFPDRTNPLLEQLPRLLWQRLAAAFQHKVGLAVWHPYPVSPGDLFRAMRPFVGDTATASRAVASRAAAVRPPVSGEGGEIDSRKSLAS